MVVAYPVDICASLADVPGGIVLAFAALNLEKSGVFVLVPESALEPSEHGLGVKPSGPGSHLIAGDAPQRLR